VNWRDLSLTHFSRISVDRLSKMTSNAATATVLPKAHVGNKVTPSGAA
jgi:hypothetical protein